jgi:ribosome-associated heat shock protein Hsp15
LLRSLQRRFSTDKVRKDQITQIITVLDIPESRVGAKLVDMYRRNDTPAVVPTSGVIEIIETTLSKNGTEDLQKR